ncbi:hypothetical protein ACJX0J_017781, partial [Zea mays]
MISFILDYLYELSCFVLDDLVVCGQPKKTLVINYFGACIALVTNFSLLAYEICLSKTLVVMIIIFFQCLLCCLFIFFGIKLPVCYDYVIRFHIWFNINMLSCSQYCIFTTAQIQNLVPLVATPQRMLSLYFFQAFCFYISTIKNSIIYKREHKKRILEEKNRNFICCMEFVRKIVFERNDIKYNGFVLNYCTPQCAFPLYTDIHRLNHTFVSGYLTVVDR